MIENTLRQTYIQAAGLAIVALSFLLFPGAPFRPTILMLAGAGVLTAVCYRRLCVRSAFGVYTLTAAWTALSVALVVNVWYFTTRAGGTVEYPVLLNDDSFTTWWQLKTIDSTDALPASSRMRGYASVLAALSLFTTPRINICLAFNVLATLLTIVLTGATADRIKRGSGGAAMLMMALVSYFMASGVVLIKDAFCCCLMAAWLFLLTAFTPRRPAWWIAISVCIVIATAIRPHLPVFMGLALILMCTFEFRSRIKSAAVVGFLLIIAYAAAVGTGIASHVLVGASDTGVDIGSAASGRLEAYSMVAGPYKNLHFLHKIALLPFSLAVQFFTPLPWNFMRYVVFGPSQIWAHVAYGWYIVAGIFLYYIIFMMRHSPRKAARLALFAILATMATAFMTGGTISRYCLPWLPAIAVPAAWSVTDGCLRLRSFRIWTVCYWAVVAIGLIIINITVNKVTPQGWMAV